MTNVLLIVGFGILGACFWRKPLLAMLGAWIVWAVIPWLLLESQFDSLAVAGLGVHPATAMLIGCSTAVVLLRGAKLPSLIRSGWVVLGLLLLVLGWALLVTLVGNPYGMGIYLNQLLPIFLILALSAVSTADDHTAMLNLRTLFVWIVAAQSVLALLQATTQEFIFYESDYAGQRWAAYASVFRATGTFDHYLVLSLATVVAIALVKGMRITAAIRLLLVFVLVAGNATTQSRVGLVLALAMAVYVVVSAGSGGLVKIGTVFVAVVFGVLFMASDLFGSAAARFANDSGSTSARNRAIDLFFQEISSRFFVGDGVSSSYEIAQRGFLLTSLESPLMMLSVDIGLLMATIFFGVLIWISFARAKYSLRIPGAAIAAIAALAIAISFSSFMAQGASGVILAIALAIAWRGSANEDVTETRADSPSIGLNTEGSRIPRSPDAF